MELDSSLKYNRSFAMYLFPCRPFTCFSLQIYLIASSFCRDLFYATRALLQPMFVQCSLLMKQEDYRKLFWNYIMDIVCTTRACFEVYSWYKHQTLLWSLSIYVQIASEEHQSLCFSKICNNKDCWSKHHCVFSNIIWWTVFYTWVSELP